MAKHRYATQEQAEARQTSQGEAQAVKECPSCQRDLYGLSRGAAEQVNNFPHHGGHGLASADDIPALEDDLTELAKYTGAVFHALFCCWYYDSQSNHTGMTYESIEPLTGLGEALCEEITRAGWRLRRAGEIWQERVEQRAPTMRKAE